MRIVSLLPAATDLVTVLGPGPALIGRRGPRVVRGAEVLAHVLHGVRAGAPVTADEAQRVRPGR
ncbi:hypothetical protein [Kitasatospora sp. NPDC094015]|uniref:hypothetical protein n=1 Tax=Kitasatospora sp. NPDC094015 TaxID=3155205 RepID=UPI00332818CA